MIIRVIMEDLCRSGPGRIALRNLDNECYDRRTGFERSDNANFVMRATLLAQAHVLARGTNGLIG